MIHILTDYCDKVFTVDQFCNCSIRITDRTQETGLFDYKDTVTVDIILYNSDPQQMAAEVITDHSGWLTEVKLPIPYDGWYTIYHVIVPTAEWYRKHENEGLDKDYDRIILSDGKKIYTVDNHTLKETDILDLLRIKTDRTTVQIYQKDIFSDCLLRQCYIRISMPLLNDYDEYQSYLSDFLWCSIEALKILIKRHKTDTAQKLIEELLSCKGVCYDKAGRSPQTAEYSSEHSYGIYLETDCGCSHK